MGGSSPKASRYTNKLVDSKKKEEKQNRENFVQEFLVDYFPDVGIILIMKTTYCGNFAIVTSFYYFLKILT